jgi:lambda family phage portal protein
MSVSGTPSRLLDSAGVPVPAAAIMRARMRGLLSMEEDGRYRISGSVPFAYDSADVFSQELGAWFPLLRSPDHEINRDRDRMVGRSRDLVRNDGWGTGATNRIVDNAIGAQFRLVAKPDFLALAALDKAFDAVWADEFAEVVEAGWRMYADDPARYCDATRSQTMVQMFHLALTHKVIDGEGLGVLLYLPEFVGEYGARNATTLQIVDPDRLSNPNQQLDTVNLRGGVEIDGLGAPVAYHIRRAYPSDWYEAAESMIWDRVPRETAWGRPIVVHDFDRERAGQHRGLSVLNPILSRLKMLTKYDGAELQQAILQTVFGTFITSPFDQGQVSNALQDPDDPEISAYQALRADFHRAKGLTLGGVRLPTMAPGEDIKTVSASRPGGNFSDFEHAMLRNVAAALGMSAGQVSQDWSRTNYSSARAELLDAWKTLARRRADFSIGFATPVYGAWLEEEFDKGRVPLPAGAPSFSGGRAAYMRCRWIGPGRGWIDPVKERQGEVLGLDAGFSTLEQACAEMNGADWREMIEQRAVEVAMFKRKGLKLPQWGAAEEPASHTETRPQPV